MDAVANGQFDDFTAPRAWDIGDSDDLRRDMPRTGIAANLILDLLFQRVVERAFLLQLHKQDDAHGPLPVLRDDNAFHDFRNLLDLPINLGGADPYAAGIED